MKMEKLPFYETLGDPELVLWRNRVFLRDNYTCQHCGLQIRRLLTPHHIEPISVSRHKKYDVDNGITHCYHCHAFEDHKHDKEIQKLILTQYALVLDELYVRRTDKQAAPSLYNGICEAQ